MKKIEATGGIGAGENFDEFIADALGGNDFGVGGESAEGFPGGGFDGKAELDGEADGAEEAEAVFGKAGEGIADGADLLASEIGLALNVVEEFIFEGIKKHAVDGEVAPLSIFLGGNGVLSGLATSDLLTSNREGKISQFIPGSVPVSISDGLSELLPTGAGWRMLIVSRPGRSMFLR